MLLQNAPTGAMFLRIRHHRPSYRVNILKSKPTATNVPELWRACRSGIISELHLDRISLHLSLGAFHSTL
jgi:hypothetical protein